MTSLDSPIEIIDFQPEYRDYFRTLNEAWIHKFFKLEPVDEWVLNNPETKILDPGGCILFARHRDSGRIVGTCALMKHGDGAFELTKMAVDETFQGQQIGKRLGQAIIDRVREMGLPQIMLETNSSLATAVSLYERLGFVHVPIDTPSEYARADVRMVKAL